MHFSKICFCYTDCKRLTRNFLELGHLDKDSPTTRERKAPQGKKIFGLLAWKLLKVLLKWKILPVDGHNQGIFSPNSGTFCNFWKTAGETSPVPPSSYSPGWHDALSSCDVKDLFQFAYFAALWTIISIQVTVLKKNWKSNNIKWHV